MMSSPTHPLRAGLEALEGLLLANQVPLAQQLRPGLEDSDEVGRELGLLGLVPTDDLREWFRWHNGVLGDPPCSASVSILYWRPLSLAEALAAWQSFDKGRETWQWWPDWLPLAYRGDSYWLAVNCSAPAPNRAVREIDEAWAMFGGEDSSPEVEDLGTLVHWWFEAISFGHWTYDFTSGLWRDTNRGAIPVERRRSGFL